MSTTNEHVPPDRPPAVRGRENGSKETMRANADFHYERRIKPDGEQTTIVRGSFGIMLLVGAGTILAGLQLLVGAG